MEHAATAGGSPTGTEPGGWRSIVRRHPLVTFLVVVFGISWPVLSLPVLQAHGLLAGPPVPVPLFVLAITFGVLVPAALAVTYVLAGRRGVLALLRRAVAWRFGGTVWLLLVLGVPAVALALGVVGPGAFAWPGGSELLGDVGSAISAVLVIHLSEELVWAGFLQQRLGERHHLLATAGLTAVPFAALHLPLSLLGEITVRSVAGDAAGLLVLGLLLRLAVGVTLALTGGSVLAVAVLHGSFNGANNDGGLVDDLLTGADPGLVAVLSLLLLTLVGWLHTSRRAPSGPRGSLQIASQPGSQCHHRHGGPDGLSAGPTHPHLPQPRLAAGEPRKE